MSLAVGLGNAVDVTAASVLDYLADDPATGAVALHVESVRDGRRLTDAVSRLTERVPVAALVVGRHDVGAFAASHTGALATSWRTTRAALAQAGAVLVGDERELIAAAAALAVTRARPSREPGVGVVTAQAGPGLLLLDDLRGRRVSVPELTAGTQQAVGGLLPPLTFQRNPVDTGRPSPELGRVLSAVAADPGVDIVAGYALYEPEAVDLATAVQEGQVPGVPVVFGVAGLGKDMINRGGEKISAEEVENLLYRLPAVSQVAAVAMPDAVLGERVCVYVVPRAGAELTLEQVRRSMEDAGVARYKLPEHLVLTESLPVTKVGKIDKKALRADVAQRLATPKSEQLAT